jgi:hypothetical protein
MNVTRKPAAAFAIVAAIALSLVGPAITSASHAPGTSCTPGRDLVYDGHTWFDPARDYVYRIIRSSFPAEFDTAREQERVMNRIKAGARAWAQGRNDCHFRRHEEFRPFFDFDFGSTAANHSDDVNTIDFAPGAQCPPLEGVLGCATVRYRIQGTQDVKAGTMRIPAEADIRFDRSRNWHIGVGRRGCTTGEYDLRSVATHEVGHVVGLDDLYNNVGEPDNGFQTMFHSTADCEFRKRQLGRSDWIGLVRLYSWP